MAAPGESTTKWRADLRVRRDSGGASPFRDPAGMTTLSAADLRGTRPIVRRPAVTVALIGKIAAVALWLLTGWHLAAAILFFGAGLFVVYHLLVPSASGVCRVVTRFKTTQREVWLTIDDGPDPVDTPKILDLLDRHDAKATFFVVGERAERHQDLIREIVRRGHALGNHTYTHPVAMFWSATPRRVALELDLANAALSHGEVQPEFFRAPVGIKNLPLPAALASRRLRCIGWTIRSGDCIARTPNAVVRHVMRRVTPGAIILMHEGSSVPSHVRVVAIGQVLEALTQDGYRCVVPPVAKLKVEG